MLCINWRNNVDVKDRQHPLNSILSYLHGKEHSIYLTTKQRSTRKMERPFGQGVGPASPTTKPADLLPPPL
jgi:hypothetical protein